MPTDFSYIEKSYFVDLDGNDKVLNGNGPESLKDLLELYKPNMLYMGTYVITFKVTMESKQQVDKKQMLLT